MCKAITLRIVKDHMSGPQEAPVIVPDRRSGHSRWQSCYCGQQCPGKELRHILSSVSLPLSIPWRPRKPSSPTPSNPILPGPANSCFPGQSLLAGSLHPQARTLGNFLPFLAAWTLLGSLLSGLKGRTLTSPTQTYSENGWEGHSPAYLLDSLDHFLDVGVVNFSLEPVDTIGVL